jgi:hypothetical protein
VVGFFASDVHFLQLFPLDSALRNELKAALQRIERDQRSEAYLKVL